MPDNIKDFQIKIVTSADLKAAQDSAKALQEVGTEAKKSSDDQVNSQKPVEDAEKKAFASKKDLRSAVKGLKDEFPALAHIARLAINPIAFAVFGVTGAFAIFRLRVQEATKALSEVELPDLSAAKIGQVTAMAEAWKSYKDALEGVTKAYNSVEAASGRALKAFEAESDQQKKLLQAKKGLELADLEANKTKMSETEYQRRKLDIEDRYEKAGVQAEAKKKAGEIALKKKEADDLREDAGKKTDESKKIKVGSAEQDAGTLEDMKQRADAAQKDIDERKAWIGKMLQSKNLEGSVMENIGTDARMLAKYGYRATTDKGREDAIATERGVIASEQVNIDRYNARKRGNAAREESRQRKTGLAGEAGQEMGKASVLDAEVKDDTKAAGQEAKVGSQVAGMDSQARLKQALATAREDVKKDKEAIVEAMTHSSALSQSVVEKMQQHNAALKELEKRVQAMEGRPPRI